MPPSGPHQLLATAHLALAAVTLLFAGWLQSALSPQPWWQKDMDQLGDLAFSVSWLRFAALAYLLLAALCEWRLAVGLRRGRTVRPFVGMAPLTAHGLMLIGAVGTIARGTASRALFSDLDEWLTAMGVCAALALMLGLWTARRLANQQFEGTISAGLDERASNAPRRLVFALVIAAGATLSGLAMLESCPLPHVTEGR